MECHVQQKKWEMQEKNKKKTVVANSWQQQAQRFGQHHNISTCHLVEYGP